MICSAIKFKKISKKHWKQKDNWYDNELVLEHQQVYVLN